MGKKLNFKPVRTTILIDQNDKVLMDKIAETLQISVDSLLRLIIHDHLATLQSYNESNMMGGNHA